MPNQLETVVGTFGPEDVDAAGDLAPKMVKQQDAQALIDRVRASYPVELVTIQQRDEDRARTKALVDSEIHDAAVKAFGDGDAKGGVVGILSARVRGRSQPVAQKMVVVLWETSSHRTARGAFPYADLDQSIDRFDQLIASGEVSEVDEGDPKDLRRTIDRNEETIKRLNKRLASGEAGDPTAGTGLTEDDVARLIKDAIGDKAAEVVEEAEADVKAKDERIAELEAELAEKEADDGSADDESDGDGDQSAGATEDPDAGAPAEPQAVEDGEEFATVEAPKGKQSVLLGAMDGYSAAQLDALLEAEKAASRPRPKVIEAAEAARQKLDE